MTRLSFQNISIASLSIIIATLFCASLAYGQTDQAISTKKFIRFYKVNKDMQADRIMLTDKKSTNSGCNNFIKQVRVYKTVQTGFLSCTLYSEKDCPIPSLIPVATEKNPRKTFLLTEGKAWYAESKENPRGFKTKSWQCDQQTDVALLARESQLATLEVARLERVSHAAKKKAEAAQKKADKAKKIAKQAVEQAAQALKKAVDAGYTPPPVVGASIKTKDKKKNSSEKADNEDTKN
jgi:hypothetical protein